MNAKPPDPSSPVLTPRQPARRDGHRRGTPGDRVNEPGKRVEGVGRGRTAPRRQHPCGTPHHYWRGCAEPQCRDAVRQHELTYRRQLAYGRLPDQGLVPAARTWEIINGLCAMGYTKVWIAQQIGRAHQFRSTDRIYRRTAQRVEDLARRIGQTPGPSHYNRARYQNAGYSTPDYWDDDGLPRWWPEQVEQPPRRTVDQVAVERAMDGHKIRLNIAERTEAIRRLHARGTSANQIALLLRSNLQRVHLVLDRLASEGTAPHETLAS